MPQNIPANFVEETALHRVIRATTKQLNERTTMTAFETETSFRARTVELMTPPRTAGSKPATLLQAVQAAAQKIEHRLLRPVAENEGSLAFQPRVLLALI